MLFRYLSFSISLAFATAHAGDRFSPDHNANNNANHSYRLIQRPDGTVQREMAPKRQDGQQTYIIELNSKAVLPRLQPGHRHKGLHQLAAPLLLQAENQVKFEQQQLTQTLLQDQLISDLYASTNLLLNTLIVTANPADIDKIAALPNVKKVHADRELRLYRDRSIPLIQADKTWALKDNNGTALSGKGIRVGVLDSGIDYTHPDLGGCFGEGCKVAGGYDFYNNDADPIDTDGHGTHVAGIIAGNGAVKGVAPEATLYAYQVCNYYCPTSGVIQALERAADPDQNPLTADALDVVNLSLGGPGNSNDVLTIAANNASKAGIVVVVAAGNDGEAYNALGTPGNAEQAITVAASDFNDKISGFSSRGPSDSDLVLKPDLAAPGDGITSTMPGNQQQQLSGTSMAAPHVAGAAALLKQQNNSRTPGEIKSLLVNSSKKLNEPLSATGSGRLDVFAAAQNQLTFSPSSLSFGKYEPELTVWTAKKKLKLHNHNQQNTTLTLSVPDVPAGVTVKILDKNQQLSQVTMAADSSIELSIQLTVDRTLYQEPAKDLLQHLLLVVQSPQQQQRVALGFFVYNKVQIDSPLAIERLQIYNQAGQRKFDGSLPNQSQIRLPKSQSYDFIAEYDGYDQMQLVVLENQPVPDNGSIRISPELAVYKLEITEIHDQNGGLIPAEQLLGGLTSVELRHPTKPMFYNKYFAVLGEPAYDLKAGPVMFKGKTLWMSPISSQYQLAAFGTWLRLDTAADQSEIYSWNVRLQGVNAHLQERLDAAKMQRLHTVIAPDQKPRKLSFAYKSELALGSADFAYTDTNGAIGYGRAIADLPAQTSHAVTMYGQPLSLEPQFGTGLFNLDVINTDLATEFGGTGVRRFQDNQGVAELEVVYDNNPPYARKLTVISQNQRGEHQLSLHHDWVSAKTFAYQQKYNLDLVRQDIFQSRYNQYFVPQPELTASALLRCDYQPGQPISAENYRFQFSGNCKRADLEVKYQTALAEVYQDSFSKITLTTLNTHVQLQLKRLQFGWDNHVDHQLSQGKGFIEFEVPTSSSSTAEIHYKGRWQSLALQSIAAGTSAPGYYRAEFSLPDTASLASFRIRAEDAKGNKIEHLLQNAAIVGPKPAGALLLDNDKDGLADVTDKDDDNDNISDIDELRYNLDIYQNDNNTDLDNDGLTNQQELAAGTFPDQADSDLDLMPDGYEQQAGFNPLYTQDGSTDPDFDSLNNAAEYQHKTDPRKADTDGDTMPDGYEVKFGLKPLDIADANADLDNDQLTNLDEFKQRTNPTQADTDNDGMPDGFEVKHSLNPLDASDAGSDKDQNGLTALQEFKGGTNPTVADKSSGGGGSSTGGTGNNNSNSGGGGSGGSFGFGIVTLAAVWCYRRQKPKAATTALPAR